MTTRSAVVLLGYAQQWAFKAVCDILGRRKSMIRSEVRAFLQQPLVACMSVIDDKGFPHSVPVIFLLDGEEIVITSARSTRKVD